VHAWALRDFQVLSLANNDMDDKELTALLEQLRLTNIPVGSLDLSGCSRLTDSIATDLVRPPCSLSPGVSDDAS
jgi:hypothetical protein